MKSKRANPSSKPSPSATPSSAAISAEPVAEAAQQTSALAAGDWFPLAFLETSGVYLFAEEGRQNVMLSRLYSEAGPSDNHGWRMRLTSLGVFIHKPGAPMQWIAPSKCVRGIVGLE